MWACSVKVGAGWSFGLQNKTVKEKVTKLRECWPPAKRCSLSYREIVWLLYKRQVKIWYSCLLLGCLSVEHRKCGFCLEYRDTTVLPEKTTTSKNKSNCPGTCHNKREEGTIGTPSRSRMQKKEGRKDTSVQMAILKVSCGSKRKVRPQKDVGKTRYS